MLYTSYNYYYIITSSTWLCTNA